MRCPRTDVPLHGESLPLSCLQNVALRAKPSKLPGWAGGILLAYGPHAQLKTAHDLVGFAELKADAPGVVTATGARAGEVVEAALDRVLAGYSRIVELAADRSRPAWQNRRWPGAAACRCPCRCRNGGMAPALDRGRLSAACKAV